MSLADHSFNEVLSFYEGKVDLNQKSDNIYKEHFFVMNFIAKEDRVSISNDLPQVTFEELNKFNKSKLLIKDQWASHPSVEDRIAMLEKVDLIADQVIDGLANDVFNNIETIQQQLTTKLFSEVEYVQAPSVITLEQFKAEYKKGFEEKTFPRIYNAYYDFRDPYLLNPTFQMTP